MACNSPSLAPIFATLPELAVWAAEQRVQGQRLVLTNGCFDVLHVGHLRSLIAARQYGDVLIVGINTDASVRALKGPRRPIVPAPERAEMVAALRPVSAVALFADVTADALLVAAHPHVYVKGADYARADGSGVDETRLTEATTARRLGVELALLPYIAGRSTTRLIAQMHEQRPD